MIGAGLAILSVLEALHVNTAVGLAVFLMLCLTGERIFRKGLPCRLILDGTRIEIRRLFRRFSANRTEIEGSFVGTSGYGSWTMLLLRGGRRAVRIPRSIVIDSDLRVRQP